MGVWFLKSPVKKPPIGDYAKYNDPSDYKKVVDCPVYSFLAQDRCWSCF